MRGAITALAVASAVAGCSVGGTDPYSATCDDVRELTGLNSVAGALAEDIAPSRNPDQITGRIAVLISRECERATSLNYRPGRAVERTARRELGL